jgi:hypothetical protein
VTDDISIDRKKGIVPENSGDITIKERYGKIFSAHWNDGYTDLTCQRATPEIPKVPSGSAFSFQ